MRVKIKTVWNFITSHAHHHFINIKRLYRKLYAEQHQLTSTTSRDRYPYLFNEAKRYAEVFLKEKELSILSFGCSTGEECISLKSYFPESRIVGVDINKSNIRKADKNNFSPGITYMLSTPENIADKGKYDLIFCLSVLCRWEETKAVENCEKIYSF